MTIHFKISGRGFTSVLNRSICGFTSVLSRNDLKRPEDVYLIEKDCDQIPHDITAPFVQIVSVQIYWEMGLSLHNQRSLQGSG